MGFEGCLEILGMESKTYEKCYLFKSKEGIKQINGSKIMWQEFQLCSVFNFDISTLSIQISKFIGKIFWKKISEIEILQIVLEL